MIPPHRIYFLETGYQKEEEKSNFKVKIEGKKVVKKNSLTIYAFRHFVRLFYFF